MTGLTAPRRVVCITLLPRSPPPAFPPASIRLLSRRSPTMRVTGKLVASIPEKP